MNELAKALDDIDGLLEAFRALSDEQRPSTLTRSAKAAKALRHEMAAGMDAYTTTLMSSARGELNMKRVRKCRLAAFDAMPTAKSKQKHLAELVSQHRLAAPGLRDDLERLLSLSLHGRNATASLAATIDRRAVEAIGNKVLVELRGATLAYLAAARTANDGDPARPRAAVVEQLHATEGHANKFMSLAPAAGVTGDDASLGATLSRDVVAALHRTSVDWLASPVAKASALAAA